MSEETKNTPAANDAAKQNVDANEQQGATIDAKETTGKGADKGKKATAQPKTVDDAGKGKKADSNDKPSGKLKVRVEKKEIEGPPIVEIDGQEFEIVTPRFEVPGFGTFTNREAATNADLIRYLIEKKSKVLREVF